MAPATAPTGPSTRAPDNAPSAASPVRSWAIAAELSARESVTAAIVFFIRYLPPTLHKNNNIGGVLTLCRGCHINQTMSAEPRAFVLVLQLSTAYPQSAETHHDRIMNPTAASVLGCVAANCSAGLRLELTALAGGTLRYAARVCFLRFRALPDRPATLTLARSNLRRAPLVDFPASRAKAGSVPVGRSHDSKRGRLRQGQSKRAGLLAF
jgi:hypothetical protein